MAIGKDTRSNTTHAFASLTAISHNTTGHKIINWPLMARNTSDQRRNFTSSLLSNVTDREHIF
ncbi:uncharacterized protein MYCGRDRAFT_83763 [Zymoseptoria tritici IPO323]|uniref:Uncharacterized protein n=1 Tax=Zymoseptoria tritici (strain CBS 115943 / IPO323) TaxID=336722 RepID=F9X027_ZYMTI|nr:uncharacterized protein MYCGRDRAFT_83763 [Zymoseptoria tritici IPO323]EGP91273.1 hypothetical protein MYCGRDRAFT_83763 [Zymoseptoria tritici IPO323]